MPLLSRYARLAFSTSLLLFLFTYHASADTTGKWVSGEQTYQKVCGYCHEVGVGPYLLGRQFPSEIIQYTARNGTRAMPAFKPSFIDDAALKAVSDYIYNSKAPETLPPGARPPSTSIEAPKPSNVPENKRISATQVAAVQTPLPMQNKE